MTAVLTLDQALQGYSLDALDQRLVHVTKKLMGQFRALAETEKAEHQIRVDTIRNAEEGTVAGRDRLADIAAVNLHCDLIGLRSEIRALEAERTLLLVLMGVDRADNAR